MISQDQLRNVVGATAYDRDGDKIPNEDDCKPDNPSIHPGAFDKPEGKLGQKPDHFRGFTNIGPSMDYLERAYDDAKYGW